MVSSWIANIKSFCVFIESSAPAPNPAIWICKWENTQTRTKKCGHMGWMSMFGWPLLQSGRKSTSGRWPFTSQSVLLPCLQLSPPLVEDTMSTAEFTTDRVAVAETEAFFSNTLSPLGKRVAELTWISVSVVLSAMRFILRKPKHSLRGGRCSRFLCRLVLQTRESAKAPPPMPLISISIQHQVKPEMIVIYKNLMRQEKGTLAVSNYSYTR